MSVWTNKLRGPAIGLTLVSALVVAGPLHAVERAGKTTSKQEDIGVISGLTVGALAGGPVGAVVGAATGALLGERYHRQAEEKSALAAELSRTRTATVRLRNDLALTREQGLKLGLAVDRSRDLEMTIGFRTGDSNVSDADVVRLQKLGALIAAVDDATVRIAGFADPRGSEEFNAALSERRAEAVAHVLIEAGVDPTRLAVEAHGETEATTVEGDLDGYAFDRRVTVRIERDSGEATVARN